MMNRNASSKDRYESEVAPPAPNPQSSSPAHKPPGAFQALRQIPRAVWLTLSECRSECHYVRLLGS